MSNEQSNEIKFAYWVPNVSGGLVVSKIEQRTHWEYDYNKKLAQLAEENGFEYALSQVRYMASYGAENQHESTSFSLALLLATTKLKVIAAIHPGLWQPGVLAKLVATADHLSNGRIAVNVVSGWFKGEFTALGEPWLEHDERYRRSEEFIRSLKGAWSEDNFSFSGDFYRFHGYNLKPKPLHEVEVFQGGNSVAARAMAARVSDWYFMNGTSIEGARAQIDEIRANAAKHGRSVKFGLNAFIIARETTEEAHAVLREIIAKADVEAVHGFGEAVKQAGKSTQEKQGMWANSNFEDLVQYNDGFKTGLVGTPEQIARRIVEYKAVGVDLILGGFLHYLEDVEYFGQRILPLVRQYEAEAAARGSGGVSPPALLATDGVSLSFRGVAALTEVSFEVAEGEICALIGPNGAGKSSLLNVISGVYRPDRGTIRFAGETRPGFQPNQAARWGIARTFQNLALFPGMSVLDNVKTGRTLRSHATVFEQALHLPRARREERESVERARAALELVELQERHDTPVGQLPYGLQKRVELARALAGQPRLLLLDEPMAGMTFEEKQAMSAYLLAANRQGITLVLIEHDLGVVMDLSHHVVVLDYGKKIADGAPEAVREQREVIEAYLGPDHDRDEDGDEAIVPGVKKAS